MNDLKNVERNFHDLIGSCLSERFLEHFEFPQLSDKLLKNQSAVDLPPFGAFFYFLAIEDGKPVLYVNARSRMDLDLDRLCIVDGESFEWIEDGDYTKIRQEHGVSGEVVL